MTRIFIMFLSFMVLYGLHVHAGMIIVSQDDAGQPMAQGVCDIQAPVANDGAVAFIAPMPERTDSFAKGFHASYLKNNGSLRELLPGYERALAQSKLSIYSKTTSIRLAANHDFNRFAVVIEFIKLGQTDETTHIREPLTVGTQLVVVNENGNILTEAVLDSDKGNVSASQCHVSFSENGKLLAACGQYLGLRLYDAPTADLSTFHTLDVGYTTGCAVITGDGTKVFFPRDDTADKSAICCYDVATGDVVDTGLRTSRLISDAQLSVSRDGSCVVFRRSMDSLVVASKENGQWKETVIEGTEIRQPAVSADGRYVVYQVYGTSCFQIMSYDRWKETTTTVSLNENGEEADADCTSPSISDDGLKVAFVSTSTNLVTGSNGQPQLYLWERSAPSITLQLKSGWNLCGLPFAPDHNSVAQLLDIGVCWGYVDGKFKPLNSFMAGQGFWLYSMSDVTLRVTGEEAKLIALHRGWNLVLPSVTRMKDMKACFGLTESVYVRLKAPTNSAKPVWAFH